jgi:hypothetical protein
MRVLKDGRVKLKFNELRIGQVFYCEFFKHKDYIKSNYYILITGIHQHDDGEKWFTGMKSRVPNDFRPNSIPDLKNINEWYGEHFGSSFLRMMYLQDTDKQKGRTWLNHENMLKHKKYYKDTK